MQSSSNSASDSISETDSDFNKGKIQSDRRSDNILNSMPLLHLGAGRKGFLEYFENTWSLTEMLFSCLRSKEAFFLRPYHKTRHPLIFYYAHPACFYANKLLVSGLINEPVNQALELLFETGVDEMNWDDLHEGDQNIWPEMDEVIEYRQQVHDLVHDLIQTHPCFDGPVTMDSQAWSVAMAFEHERIHLETSSVLIRELPAETIQTPDSWPDFFRLKTESGDGNTPTAGVDYPGENPMIEVAACTMNLGKPEKWPSFGWDNEYGSDKRLVQPFKASQFLVSNGEFYRFVAEGGYEKEGYWSRSGWGWRQFRNIKWPTFWVQDGPSGSHRYKLRTTFSVEEMQWDWPVIVNFYEARAYCQWLSESTAAEVPFRLLQEAEHLALREPETGEAVNWSEQKSELLNLDPVMDEHSGKNFNLNLRFGAECPVNAMPGNSRGFHDAMGNVWQWCDESFRALPGFRIHPYYTDFSTPCFDGEHQMLLGGSFISTGDEASIWARFHFRPHFFQHAGFRLAQSNVEHAKAANKYETSELVDQYLLFHYGSPQEQRDHAISSRVGHPDTVDFVLHTADLANRFAGNKASALDLGCAVGRSSFELARNFNEVTGVDFSSSFIESARQLKSQGQVPYQRIETGRYFTGMMASVPAQIDRSKVRFVEGDACKLDDALPVKSPFDVILLANLLCRLPDPAACLRQFVDTESWLKKGGVLVIASPNTWSENYTPQQKYLDGLGSEDTIAQLRSVLHGFELVYEEDCPFMIREHRRKYEYIISQVTVWKKIAIQGADLSAAAGGVISTDQ
ncbi:MAG: 5-histidylcysteine sulfoxide synthase [Gammaproteobacteria bacterium]|nr:5-histidylcysteine sulfoxide synthase [Gammaproteobacteria bacterium]